MPAYSVGIDIHLLNRVSRGLRQMSAGFLSADARVKVLQRSLNDLQKTNELSGRRAQIQNQLDRQAIQMLPRRVALIQEGAAIRARELDSVRAERLETERLIALEQKFGIGKPGHQATLEALQGKRAGQLAAEQVVQQRLAEKAQADQLRIMQLQNDAKLRGVAIDQRQNRLLMQRRDIQEKNLALTKGRSIFARFASPVGIAASIAAAIGVGSVHAAIPIERSMVAARMAGNLTAAQQNQLAPMAQRLSKQIGLFSFGQVAEALPTLIGAMNLRGESGISRIAQIAPSFLRAAAIQQGLFPQNAEPLPETVGALASAATALGTRTPAQMQQVARMIGNIVAQSGGRLSLAGIAESVQQVAPATAGVHSFTQRLQMARFGAVLPQFLPNVSASEAERLYMALLQPRPRELGAISVLERSFGLSRAPQGRTPANITTMLGNLQRQTHGTLPLSLRVLAPELGPLLLNLQQMQRANPGTLQAMSASFADQQTLRQRLVAVQSTTYATLVRLVKSIESLAAVIGLQLLPPVKDIANVLTATTQLVNKAVRSTASVPTPFSTILTALFPEVAVSKLLSSMGHTVTVKHEHHITTSGRMVPVDARALKHALNAHIGAHPVTVSPFIGRPVKGTP